MRVSDLIKELQNLNENAILKSYTNIGYQITGYCSYPVCSYKVITDVKFNGKYSSFIEIDFFH
jgi:hypothetical protein